jgi:hypothetical protein
MRMSARRTRDRYQSLDWSTVDNQQNDKKDELTLQDDLHERGM